jgi:hypothetical protein
VPLVSPEPRAPTPPAPMLTQPEVGQDDP